MKELVSFFFVAVVFFFLISIVSAFFVFFDLRHLWKKRGLFFTEDVPEQLLKET